MYFFEMQCVSKIVITIKYEWFKIIILLVVTVVNEKVPKEFVVQILKVLNAKFLLGLNILGDGLIF